MNAHQRRIAKRAYDRANELDEDEGYCQDCGDFISFADGTAYVTASGDVYCRACGRAADEAMMDEENEFAMWDYNTWNDVIEGESGGVYIGPENDTMGGAV